MTDHMEWDMLGDRPAKRPRIDEPPQSPAAASDTFDDTEDLYSESPVKPVLDAVEPADGPAQSLTSTSPQSISPSRSLPGLGMLRSALPEDAPTAAPNTPLEAEPESASGPTVLSTSNGSGALVADIPHADRVPTGGGDTTQAQSSLMATQVDDSTDIGMVLPASDKKPDVLMEEGWVESAASHKDDGVSAISSFDQLDGKSDDPEQLQKENKQELTVDPDQQQIVAVTSQPMTHDADPLIASELNQGDPAAEWQYDSSDVVSHSSDSDSDSSSDDSEADCYQLLGPEEQARILMAEEGGSDDEGAKGKKPGIRNQPRTQNEIPEVQVQKPDVTVTPEMQISELGVIDGIVENFVLIKGTISAETKVLQSGSVLCLPDRKVIGAIAEPIGRVEAPYYSVAFNNAAEIVECDLEIGAKILYVKDHSSYVFTQPLKNMKGSDASNIHDEEVGGDEMEFSDDEAEAEYKRQKKQEKLAKKGIVPNPHHKPGEWRGDSAHSRFREEVQYPTDPIKYEDDDNDGMYKPLARPSEQLNPTLPPRPRTQDGPNQRVRSGRGQGGDRGRTDRGRGDRGRGNRGRGRGQGFDDRNPRENGQTQQQRPPYPSSSPTMGQGQNWSPTSFAPSNQASSPQYGQFPTYFPAGGHFNPAFFAAQSQNYMQGQSPSQPFQPRQLQQQRQQWAPHQQHIQQQGQQWASYQQNMQQQGQQWASYQQNIQQAQQQFQHPQGTHPSTNTGFGASNR